MFLITSNQSSEVKLTWLVFLYIVYFSVGNKGRFPVILYIAIPGMGKYRYVGGQVFTKKNSKFLTQQKSENQMWVVSVFRFSPEQSFQVSTVSQIFKNILYMKTTIFFGHPNKKKLHWIKKTTHTRLLVVWKNFHVLLRSLVGSSNPWDSKRWSGAMELPARKTIQKSRSSEAQVGRLRFSIVAKGFFLGNPFWES